MEKWEWAWLAGIYEGEGCMGFTGRCGVQIRVCMTDRDVVERIESLCPSPNGVKTQKYRTNKKLQYRWQISDRDIAKAFIEGVLPFLGIRRAERAREGLERIAVNPGAKSKRTHCLRGHPLFGKNLYVQRTGARSCRTCRAARDVAKHAREKAARAAERATRLAA